MNLIKTLIVGAVASTSLLFTAAQASTITTEKLLDNYIGSNGQNVSYVDSYDYQNNNAVGNDYEIYWMDVSRTIENGTTSLTVKVNSEFVTTNANNGSGGLKFGDLFLMDGAGYSTPSACNDGSGNVGCNEFTEQTTSASGGIDSIQSNNQWQYAFDLGGNRNDAQSTAVSGSLRDLSDINSNINDAQEEYEASIKSTNNNREWQAIMSNDSEVDNKVGSGEWHTLLDDDLLVMTFDITGTSLATVDQIALRWAMTCANDIIEVVANLKDKVVTNVPAPTAFMFMLTAFAGLVVQRRKSRM